MSAPGRGARGRMQAKEIPDAAFLDAVRVVQERKGGWASRWSIGSVLAGHEPDHWTTHEMTVDEHGQREHYPEMPERVVLAKARKLVRRGLLDGCCCGCRGDFEIVPPSDLA